MSFEMENQVTLTRQRSLLNLSSSRAVVLILPIAVAL